MKRGLTIAAVALLAVAPDVTSAAGLDTISDVRVEPILSTQWSQANFGGAPAFNLYTPNNLPCGCVIIAYAQVMHHWRAPSGPVAQASYSCWVEGTPMTYTMMGGVYNWDAMPLTDAECTEQYQREALGRLTYDLGVASRVNWAEWSSTWSALTSTALKERFGYASARTFRHTEGEAVTAQNLLSFPDYRNAILASLDAGMPVVLGIDSTIALSHQVVVDGYGFNGDGRVYCHLNFGWWGGDDMWYDIISEELTEFRFSGLDEVGYNIHPSVPGDVISGRVLDVDGNPAANVKMKMKDEQGTTLSETETNSKGIYSFRFTGKGKFTVSAEDAVLGRGQRTISVAKAGSDIDFVQPTSPNLMQTRSFGIVANRWGEDIALKPAPAVGTVAGRFDTSFGKAQNVMGALYGANGGLLGTVQLKAGKINESKRTVKISASATLMDGKKANAKAASLTLLEDGTMSGPVTFKAPVGTLTLDMAADGTFSLKGDAGTMTAANIGGALNGGAKGTFSLDNGFNLAVPGEMQSQLLPTNVTFDAAGGKWTFAKNATVKWAKDKATNEYGLAVDGTNGKTNLSSLKLTYTAKTGIFKGSFKVYALEGAEGNKKLKKYTVNVVGFVVDGRGVGQATCKKPVGGPWTVTVTGN